jgi:hypothetical protein
LQGVPFPALWGRTLVIYDVQNCELVSAREAVPADQDAILLRLDEHLDALSRRLGLAEPVAQLPLFAAVPVDLDSLSDSEPHSAKGMRS